jgi:hypothetical protein
MSRLPPKQRAVALLLIALFILVTLWGVLKRPSADEEYRACLKDQVHLARANGYETPDASFKVADEICMHPSNMSREQAMGEWRTAWAQGPSS